MCVCVCACALVRDRERASAHTFSHTENALRGSLGRTEIIHAASPTRGLSHVLTGTLATVQAALGLSSWGRSTDFKAEV